MCIIYIYVIYIYICVYSVYIYICVCIPSSRDDWIPLNQGMQFMEAIFCGGTCESQKEAHGGRTVPVAPTLRPRGAAPEASCFELVFHLISLPWKLSLDCMGWRRKKGMIRHGYLFNREHDDHVDES